MTLVVGLWALSVAGAVRAADPSGTPFQGH